MWEFLKKHYGKIFAGTTGTIIFTVGGYWFSDIRYAHAADVAKDKIVIQQQIDQLRKDLDQLAK